MFFLVTLSGGPICVIHNTEVIGSAALLWFCH